MNISILILTFNEEQNIGNCLESVSWSDDIVVLDSYSTDKTEEISRKSGARFIERKFDNYANQRNYGIKEIEYKHEWLLMLDADETAPEELRHEIDNAIKNCSDETTLFRMRRKDYFIGKWIKHSSAYPVWFGRLFRPQRTWVEREINEEFHTDGEISYLQEHIYHYPFNKGFESWIEKHNRYSSMEAKVKFDIGSWNFNWSSLFSMDPAKRRKAIKGLVYSLPARPLIVFLGLYIIRGGILEGRSGLTYCTLKMIYEYMIDCKLRELKRRKTNLPL